LTRIYARSEDGALRQGEIITGLVHARLDIETVEAGEARWIAETHPYAITLSQDCDLDQDWKSQPSADKPNSAARPLSSVLFAQVHEAIDLKGRGGLNSELWKRVRQNKDERFHFLEAVSPENDAVGIGLPEMGIDFKQYFTIPTEEVYRRLQKTARRRCHLASPYLEHLSTRFCYYQFRVALPLDHQSV